MEKKLILVISILVCCYSFKSIAIDAKTKILDVPYKVQPNNKTCQSSCLKMLSMYFDVPSKSESIEDIYKSINEDPKRPNKTATNSWENILWWWNTKAVVNSRQAKMKNSLITDHIQTIEMIVSNIDSGKPLMMSVTNDNAKVGHFVLVIGYREYIPNQSNPNFKLICHDPFGRFFPELTSKIYGEYRHEGGYSKMDGSEFGPGAGVEISIESLKKINKDKEGNDYYAFFNLD